MTKSVAPALRALLDRLIDYAGIFPPAALTRDVAVENYEKYAKSDYAWMLRWLVVNAADVPSVPASLDGLLSVLGDEDEPRAAIMETKSVVKYSRPTYCEVPITMLDEVKRAGSFAKIRTGGLKPEAIPSVEAVASFILYCADKRLGFKATAGLHHPIRAMQPLTYEANPKRAVMHGFINVFMAAAFAYTGKRDIEPVLAETDPAAFFFDDRGHWRDWSLEAEQIRNSRRDFAHSAGSCSFEEPIQDLASLGFFEFAKV